MVERQTTRLARVCDLVSGRFIQGDKETMRANTVVTSFGEKVSRVKLVGTVVDRFNSDDGRFASLTIDDGTGVIRARVFGSDSKMIEGFFPGDLVAVGGKVKRYNDENYVAPEYVRRLDDPNEETLFRLNVLDSLVDKKRAADDLRRVKDQMSEEEILEYASEKYSMSPEEVQAVLQSEAPRVDYKPMLLDIIRRLDAGDGVEIGKILEAAKLDESMAESAIGALIDGGDVYEPTAGRLKAV
jgi:RPA family protein